MLYALGEAIGPALRNHDVNGLADCQRIWVWDPGEHELGPCYDC
jgi:hypothetical protein